MSCNKGVFRAPRKDLEAFTEGRARSVRCASYGTHDGMRTAECNGGFTPSSWRASDGRLWFPTGTGASVVDPSRLRAEGLLPPVLVEAVLVDGRAADAGKPVAVAAGSRNVEVRFTAPSFVSPRSVRFRYRLDGFDEEWVEAGPRRVAYYTSLPSGEYRFQVRACNSDGAWNEGGSGVVLAVAARFHQTAAFYGLCLLGVAAAALGAFRWRVRRERKVEEAHVRARALLEKLVAERTAQLEAANRKLEAANDELEAFSYSVSHDLRAPLRAIEGFSTLVVERYGSQVEPEAQRLLGIVRTNARKMARLIDDLLAFSRLGRSEMRYGRLNMQELARASFAEVVPDPGLRAKIELRVGELPEVEGDASLVKQVWLNLLSNAVKFSAKTGKPVIEVEGSVEGDRAVYRVRDNGAGFDMAYAGKLFGVFQRLHTVTEFEGTGVGLALVKRIVERHGGEVSARGELGAGATISFTLPVGPGSSGPRRGPT